MAKAKAKAKSNAGSCDHLLMQEQSVNRICLKSRPRLRSSGHLEHFPQRVWKRMGVRGSTKYDLIYGYLTARITSTRVELLGHLFLGDIFVEIQLDCCCGYWSKECAREEA